MMAHRIGMTNWDEYIIKMLNDPKGGISLQIAQLHVTFLVLLILFTLLNIIGSLLQLPFEPFWLYGMVCAGIVGMPLSYYAAPIDPKNYLGHFKKFEFWSDQQKFNYAIISLATVIMVWTSYIVSLVLYFNGLDA